MTFTSYKIKGGEYDGRFFVKFQDFTQDSGLSRWAILPTETLKGRRGIFIFQAHEVFPSSVMGIWNYCIKCDSYEPMKFPTNVLFNHFPKFIFDGI